MNFIYERAKIISEYDQEIPQSQTAEKPWHRKEESHNNHEAPGRQTKQSQQLFLPHQNVCIKERTHELQLSNYMYNTVNSDIFTAVLLLLNFAKVKFREKKSSRNGEITSSFTDIGKSCPVANVCRRKYVF